MRPLRNERGQAVVLVVLFMGVFFGLAAAVLDVGAWYREDRKLQATADAAALAGAQGLPEQPGRGGLAGARATPARTGGGVSQAVTSPSRPAVVPGDTIKVHAQKPMPGFFSKAFRINSVTIGADGERPHGRHG